MYRSWWTTGLEYLKMIVLRHQGHFGYWPTLTLTAMVTVCFHERSSSCFPPERGARLDSRETFRINVQRYTALPLTYKICLCFNKL